MRITQQIEEQKALVEMLVNHKNDSEKLMDEYASLNKSGIIIVEDPRVKLFHAMIYQMLKQETIDITFKIGVQKKTLREMTQYFEGAYKAEFEKKSRICNSNMLYTITKATKAVGAGIPADIEAKVKDFLTKYELEKETIRQKRPVRILEYIIGHG